MYVDSLQKKRNLVWKYAPKKEVIILPDLA